MAILSKLEICVLHSNKSLLLNNIVRLPTVISAAHRSKWASSHDIHSTSIQNYPLARDLPLPGNVEDINSTEKSRFSPERNRDINGSFITSIDSTLNTKQNNGAPNDPRVASYDCTGAVSLNSSMQTNVPQPFQTEGDVTNLNMPGGQWGQDHKYMSEELNKSHPINMKSTQSSGSIADMQNNYKKTYTSMMLSKPYIVGTNSFITNINNNINHVNLYSTLCRTDCKLESKLYGMYWNSTSSSSQQQSSNNTDQVTLSKKEKLKRAVKEYGATVVVFHVAISLVSLGGFYLAVTSGIDFTKFIGTWGSSDGAQAATTAAPFVVAYAIHKIFAPVRISITLASTPFIVRYLRKIGFLKPPKTT